MSRADTLENCRKLIKLLVENKASKCKILENSLKRTARIEWKRARILGKKKLVEISNKVGDERNKTWKKIEEKHNNNLIILLIKDR